MMKIREGPDRRCYVPLRDHPIIAAWNRATPMPFMNRREEGGCNAVSYPREKLVHDRQRFAPGAILVEEGASIRTLPPETPPP